MKSDFKIFQKSKRSFYEASRKAVGWYLFLVAIWQLLELIFYKEIQPRIVDDIMSLLFFQFIYRAMGE
nr:MAG TPA: hypothetical protein [Caudoviricetes sp.]